MSNNLMCKNIDRLTEEEKDQLIEALQKKVNSQDERLKITQSMGKIGDWKYSFKTQKVTISEEALTIVGIRNWPSTLVTTLDQLVYDIDIDIKNLTKDIYDLCVLSDINRFDEIYNIQLKEENISVHVIANKVFNENMEPEFAVGTIQDITERAQLEEALRQAEKMTAVGRLAGGIAHDFNNILMAASGYAELINLKTDNPTIKKYCQMILKSTRRSADLTTKLLAFSRKDSVFKANIHVHESLMNVIDLLARTLSKNIVLECRLDADRDCIFGDATEIQNIFMNLCINARDALHNGGYIRIKSENVMISKDHELMSEFNLVAGEYIMFTVVDNGHGIEKAHLKRIFEPFFTTKEIGKGTGLGLPAIYGTIATHSGAITVDSKVGKGTIFKIYLPTIKEL